MPITNNPQPTSSYPTVNVGGDPNDPATKVTPGQVGQATQGVIQNMNALSTQITQVNNNLQATHNSLTSVNTQIATLQSQIAGNKNGEPKGDQAQQLQNLMASQAALISSANDMAKQLRDLQQQMQKAINTDLPAAQAKDKQAADEQAKTQEQQQADQQAAQDAAQKASEQANSQLAASSRQLLSLKSTMGDAGKELLDAHTPSSQSEYNKQFGPGSAFNNWTDGLTS